MESFKRLLFLHLCLVGSAFSMDDGFEENFPQGTVHENPLYDEDTDTPEGIGFSNGFNSAHKPFYSDEGIYLKSHLPVTTLQRDSVFSPVNTDDAPTTKQVDHSVIENTKRGLGEDPSLIRFTPEEFNLFEQDSHDPLKETADDFSISSGYSNNYEDSGGFGFGVALPSEQDSHDPGKKKKTWKEIREARKPEIKWFRPEDEDQKTSTLESTVTGSSAKEEGLYEYEEPDAFNSKDFDEKGPKRRNAYKKSPKGERSKNRFKRIREMFT